MLTIGVAAQCHFASTALNWGLKYTPIYFIGLFGFLDMEDKNNDKKFESILGNYLALLLILILPLCFGIAFNWRVGLLIMPFSHGAYIFLKFKEINNARTNNQEN